VEPDLPDEDGADVAPDRVTDADEAGISRDAPDPVRNGGQADDARGAGR